MLVYAIVLILVMLATNSPAIRAVITRIGNLLRGKSADEPEKGGAAQ